jgi:hypothetical protein
MYLKLSVGPTRNLDDHVEDGLLSVGVEGDVMERRNNLAVLLFYSRNDSYYRPGSCQPV